ncbi:MAG: hypothetical protein JJU45_17950 [Acidimicrobiia bacterium]|nr:hypothetical protein [Acidimicrobiia bacterium]
MADGEDPDADAEIDPAVAERRASLARGRQQADREFRRAVIVAIGMVIIGQVFLTVGWWWAAMAFVALPGSVASVVLIRRWRRLHFEGA